MHRFCLKLFSIITLLSSTSLLGSDVEDKLLGFGNANAEDEVTFPFKIDENKVGFFSNNRLLTIYNLPTKEEKRIIIPEKKFKIEPYASFHKDLNTIILSDLTIIKLNDDEIDTNFRTVSDSYYHHKPMGNKIFALKNWHFSPSDSIYIINIKDKNIENTFGFGDSKVEKFSLYSNNIILVLLSNNYIVKYDFVKNEVLDEIKVTNNNFYATFFEIYNDKLIFNIHDVCIIMDIGDLKILEEINFEDKVESPYIINSATIENGKLFIATGRNIYSIDLNDYKINLEKKNEQFNSIFADILSVDQENFIIYHHLFSFFYLFNINDLTVKSLSTFNGRIDNIYELIDSRLLISSNTNSNASKLGIFKDDFQHKQLLLSSDLVLENVDHSQNDHFFLILPTYDSLYLYKYSVFANKYDFVNSFENSRINQFIFDEDQDQLFVINENNDFLIYDATNREIIQKFENENEYGYFNLLKNDKNLYVFERDDNINDVYLYQYLNQNLIYNKTFVWFPDDSYHEYLGTKFPIHNNPENKLFYYWKQSTSPQIYIQMFNNENSIIDTVVNLNVNSLDYLYCVDINFDTKIIACLLENRGVSLYDFDGDFIANVIDTNSYYYFYPAYGFISNRMKNNPRFCKISQNSQFLYVGYVDGRVEKIDISEFVSVKKDDSYNNENQKAIIVSNNKFIIPNVPKFGMNSNSEFFNITGQKIDIQYDIKYDDNYLQYEFLNKIPRGIYFLKISSSNQNKTIKILHP